MVLFLKKIFSSCSALPLLSARFVYNNNSRCISCGCVELQPPLTIWLNLNDLGHITAMTWWRRFQSAQMRQYIYITPRDNECWLGTPYLAELVRVALFRHVRLQSETKYSITAMIQFRYGLLEWILQKFRTHKREDMLDRLFYFPMFGIVDCTSSKILNNHYSRTSRPLSQLGLKRGLLSSTIQYGSSSREANRSRHSEVLVKFNPQLNFCNCT